jgi:hypothetical protein
MFLLPMSLDVVIVVIGAAAFLAGGYLMASSFAAIRLHLPQEYRAEGVYRFHIQDYAFGHAVPDRFKRQYVLSGACLAVALTAGFLIALQTRRADAMALFGVFDAVVWFSVFRNYRKLRSLGSNKSDEGKF